MEILEKRNAAAAALEIAFKALQDGDKSKAAKVKELTAELKAYDTAYKEAVKAQKSLDSLGETEIKAEPGENEHLTIGEHFAKHALPKAKGLVRDRTMSVTAPTYNFKAETDVHVTNPTLTHNSVQVDTNVVPAYRPPLAIADWLGKGNTEQAVLVYFQEKLPETVEGDFKFVPENTQTPQIHFGGYEQVQESLGLVSGHIKVSTKMFKDEAFLVSEINNRLLYQLARKEEHELLYGTDSANGVVGLLKREGIQKATYSASDNLADEILRVCTKISTTTGYEADGILINPADYQELRLSKDANGQYFAGGPFYGAYSSTSGIVEVPPLWGRRTIVTPSIPAGKVLVGAGQTGATVYRRGGITVNTAFQNGEDFTNHRATIQADSELLLAVRVPGAFCLVESA